jgi:DNA polymerase III delta subunit
LGLNDKTVITPRETSPLFYENGYYKIENELLFQPPEFSRKMLYHIYNSNLAVLAKLKKGLLLTVSEHKDLENVPSTLMICYLNGFDDAKEKLVEAKPLLKSFPQIYLSFKEAMRILRKMKYNVH